MSELIEHIALLLRAVPHMPELVFPLLALAALINGLIAGRLLRRLRRRRPTDPAAPVRASPFHR